MSLLSTRSRSLPVDNLPPVTPRWESGLIAFLGASLTVVVVVEARGLGRVLAVLAGLLITAGALNLWSRAWKTGRWVVLGLATLGLSVGIGIGLRALSIGVIDLSSTAATFALLSGGSLIWLAIARLVSPARRGWGIVSSAGLIFLVALTTWTITPALIATNVPPIEPGDATPADYGFDAVGVDFESTDGVSLWAWYATPPEGKVAIVRHGAGSTATDVLAQAAVLVSNGYGVLITDARGHGRSGGEAMDFGWFGDLDVAAAVDFLLTRPEVDPMRIVVLGLSMGGEEAIGAAGHDPRIAAVVAEGATARADADKVWLTDEYGWRGWIQTRLEWVQYTVTDLLTEASKPMSLTSAAAAMAPRELLLITAGDAPDETHAARQIAASGAENVEVWTVDGAAHIGGLGVAPEEWERTVIQFMDDALSD